jgi:hypothetical protein
MKEIVELKENKSWYFTMVKNRPLEDDKLDTYDKLTYVILCKFANLKSGQCYPSLNTLKNLVSCSKPRLIKSLKNLTEIGYIRKERRRTKSGDISNIYTIIEPKASNSKTHGVKEEDRGGKADLPKQELINKYNTYNSQATKEYDAIKNYILDSIESNSLTKIKMLKDDLENYDTKVIKKALKLAISSQQQQGKTKASIYSYQFIRSFITKADSLLKGGSDNGEGSSLIPQQRFFRDTEFTEYELSEIEL